MPVRSDVLMMKVKEGSSRSRQSFRSLLGIGSRIEDLLGN